MEYFNLMMSESFSMDDIVQLDKLIQQHHILFDKVPTYHKTPKHHFATHVPRGTAAWSQRESSTVRSCLVKLSIAMSPPPGRRHLALRPAASLLDLPV